MSDLHLDPTRRHDAVLLIEATDSNPNGDPDLGNRPRQDPDTDHGIISGQCIKRRVRDFVATFADERVYVRRGDLDLDVQHQEAYEQTGVKPNKGKLAKDPDDQRKVLGYMTDRFFDVRVFGAVMAGQPNAGQVRGPVQVSWARSIEPVEVMDWTITRVASTSTGGDDQSGAMSNMGRLPMVAYGLYRAHIFINPVFAARTGMTADDLGLVWKALEWAWDVDRTTTKGEMACRGLYVFTHEQPFGNAHAHQLFDSIRVERSSSGQARQWSDYRVTLPEQTPDGVTLTRLVG